jgi:hypothetical protein
VALGDAAIGFVRGVELAGSFFDASHGGLIAGEHTEVVLLTETLEELLDLLGRDFGIGTDDEEETPFAHTVGDIFDPGQGQHVIIGGLAGRLEHCREAVANKLVGRTAAQAVGYREVIDHLAGALDLPETIERVKVRTRRFARHQETWFRGLSECRLIDLDDSFDPVETARQLVG